MDTKNKSLMIKCSCGTEQLEMNYLKDNDSLDLFELTMWEQVRTSNKLGFLERIRWCFNILKTGYPWADSIILTTKEAKKLSVFINKHT